MADKVYSTDMRRELDMTIDTMRAYYGDDHHGYITGYLLGVIGAMAWDLDQKERQYWLEDFQKKTKEITHKLMLERLGAKESTAA